MSTQTDLLSQMLLQVLKFEELGETCCGDKRNSSSSISNDDQSGINKLTSLLRANIEEISLQVVLSQQQQGQNEPFCKQTKSQVSQLYRAKDQKNKDNKKASLTTTFSSVDQLLQCINDLSIKSNCQAIDTIRRLSTLLLSPKSSSPSNSKFQNSSFLAVERNLIREQTNPLLYSLANQLRLYATVYYSKSPSYPNSSKLLLGIARLLNELLVVHDRSTNSPIEGVRLNEAVLYNLLESLLPYIAVYEQGLKMEHFRTDCFLLRNVFTSLVDYLNSEDISLTFTDSETLLLVVLQMLVNLTQAASFATQPGLLLYKHYQISPQFLESTVIRQLTIMLRAVFGRYIRFGRPEEDLADLDLVLLKVHRLLDLCYYIVKGHDKEFYYMAECLSEIETSLGKIVEKIGEERFRACLAPVEEEIVKSGRDAQLVPLYDLLGGLGFSVLPKSFQKLQRRAMVVLFKVIQVAVVWRRSRRFNGGGGGGECSRARKIKMLMRRTFT